MILLDETLSQTYKRITFAIPVFGRFDFRLKDPAYEFKTYEISERVLELDRRLVAKGEFDAAKKSRFLSFVTPSSRSCPTDFVAIDIHQAQSKMISCRLSSSSHNFAQLRAHQGLSRPRANID